MSNTIKDAAKVRRVEISTARAEVQALAQTVNDPRTRPPERDAALASIAKVVVRGTGQSTTGATSKMLGQLTVDLIGSKGLVSGLGAKGAVKLKAPKGADPIPASVISRLDKLVD